MHPSGPAVRFRNVTHDYQVAGGVLRAVDDVTLDVAPAEIVSLLGPSGCGKSTLLRLALGLARPSEGTVAVQGVDPVEARARRTVAAIFQDAGLLPWRSVRGNVVLGLELAGVPKAEREARADAAIASVGLAGFEHFRPHALSGGMRQRAAVARALVTEPDVLFMDEPFGALDHITRERLQVDFSTMWRDRSTAVVLVTHDVEEAVFLSDRVVVLTERPGRVAAIVELDRHQAHEDDYRGSQRFFELVRRVRGCLREAMPA